ncbi:uncharacterized protein LOC110911416 isoform X2 [Helianthus annuus]|uniref:uncharacterized protein LOC110911416 isoform X2 n=1 Tax=Helianthus annuus TaxID=4232 RepID=UPI000B8F56BF|nr:uncharacterized protein LOC110911416 isoform X2 [Helianthus annuus]
MFPFKTFKSICSRVLYNQERERERNYGRERQERDTTAAIRVPPQTQRRWRLWLTSQALVPAREECLMLFQQNSGDAIQELAGKNDKNYIQVAVLPYYQIDAYVCTATRPGFWQLFSFPMKFRSSFVLRRGFCPR